MESSFLVDGGSAVIFYADSGLCLVKRNLDHKSFFSLDQYVNEFIQIISFFERSSFKLGCKTVIVTFGCVLVITHVAFFTFGRN